MWRAHTLVVVMITLAGGIVGVSAELSTEYSVDIADSIEDIPAQTVNTEWGEATITEIGSEKSGEDLVVSTDAPENESYAIRIVDSQERNLKSEFIGGGDVENRDFFLDRYEPGTYVIALTQNSGDTAVEVEPFVVKGYTVDQSVSDVTKSDMITVEIELTKINDRASDPRAVNVTLYGNGVTRIAEATKTDTNSYQANFTTDELSAGSYEIYTGIQGEDDVYNFPELIGVSDPTSVTVEGIKTSTSTPTSTPTPVSPPPSNPAPAPSPPPTSTPTPAPTSNTSIDVTRSVSSPEVTSGAQVTITTEVSGANGSVSINSTYTPAANSAAIQSTTVDGVSASPVLSQATANGSTVTLENIGADVTVTITEELTVGERVNVIHNITGNVTVGKETFEVNPVSVTVSNKTDSQRPQPVSDMDVARTVSSGSITSGEDVTVTTEITDVSESVSINSNYTPQVSSATIQSVTVNGAPADAFNKEARADGSVVTVTDIGAGQTATAPATITIVETLTVREQPGVTHNITGTVSVTAEPAQTEPGTETSNELRIDSKSVAVSPLEGAAGEFDADGDGEVGIRNLASAGRAFARGNLSIRELGAVGRAFARS